MIGEGNSVPILRKAGIEQADFFVSVTESDEINMIKKMAELTSVLILCAEKREPHRLAAYVHELAGMFHKYYAKYKIVNEKSADLSYKNSRRIYKK